MIDNTDYFVGLDIGTTSTKAIVVSTTGAVKGLNSQSYPILRPKPGWAEQDPQAIFSAVLQALHEAIAQAEVKSICAIGISSAMHSLIAIDAKNQLLTNSIIWADTRSANQADQLKQRYGQSLYERVGTPLHPMLPLSKLIWLREIEPDNFNNAAKFISIKEYILYQLLNCYVVDYAIASATGLFNLMQRTWDEQALTIAGIDPNQLSELVPSTYVLQGIKAEYATQIGIDAGTRIVVGASDGVLANLGAGAIGPDQIAVTIGTSSAVRKTVTKPFTDSQQRTFCYAAIHNQFIVGGASNNGGIVLQWFHEQFGQNYDSYDSLIEQALTIPPGSEGLLFLPFLSGERAPYWNPNARGVFFGIAPHHQCDHFARAVLEGIAFSVYSIVDVLNHSTGASQTILASGGFARSQSWLQLMADVLGTPVSVPEVYEASGFGAAVCAMIAVANFADVSRIVEVHDRYSPNPELTEQYRSRFELYQQVYTSLMPSFKRLADLQ